MKYLADWIVVENTPLNVRYCLLRLRLNQELPEMQPGQFVQAKIENSPSTFLRRPISIHYVHRDKREIGLLVQIVGNGTQKLASLTVGEKLNLIYPIGKGFSIPKPDKTKQTLLLIGGGVGIAPLLFLGQTLKQQGFIPEFLLGARTRNDLLCLDDFAAVGAVYITTEDGSIGEKGFVSNHSVLSNTKADFIYTCGPKPMMMAVARYAKRHNIPCEVSLENTMACGIGACLCCVEKTVDGNTCVCTEGPVFNINELLWQI
ncbi:MAG: dihydroorotate dehydrogenase electron transfer subunit [Candidatus Symbiothrix sp.]|jgi:dihydroorotate dehydrogenase electron transfer subunit|nr:dihydroorotate dehydrogenase electron transfer subunit [Candidatus Symbiothrix sp.]